MTRTRPTPLPLRILDEALPLLALTALAVAFWSISGAPAAAPVLVTIAVVLLLALFGKLIFDETRRG